MNTIELSEDKKSFSSNIENISKTTFIVNTPSNSETITIIISEIEGFIPKIISNNSVIDNPTGNIFSLRTIPNSQISFNVHLVKDHAAEQLNKEDTILTVSVVFKNEPDSVSISDDTKREQFSVILIVLIVIFSIISLVGLFFLIRFIIATRRDNEPNEDLLK